MSDLAAHQPAASKETRLPTLTEIRTKQPRLREALAADARMVASNRNERHEFRSTLDGLLQMIRLIWVSDAFGAQVIYRLKVWFEVHRVPVLPRVLHRIAMMTSQVAIGSPVVIGPGLYVVHGQIVVDGITEIGRGVEIAPFVTIGLRSGNFRGAEIGDNVRIGTGARIIGPVRIGNGATVGANAVVVDDVPEGATVVGAPARPVD
jgi:serine O-acetyltransferase